MASEYLKWKYRDEKPREQVELTAAEKRKNWWEYHKWHIVIAVVAIAFVASMIVQWIRPGEIRPDYQVAYVGSNYLPDDTVDAVQDGLAVYGEDLNGDGVVSVQLKQYVSAGEVGMAYSSEVLLMADVVNCDSYFFLLEDPEAFQESYHVLCRLDGTLPEENDNSAEGTYLNWMDCPSLAKLSLGSYSVTVLEETVSGDSIDLIAPLCLARRGFWTNQTSAYPEGCAKLWEILTLGA